MKNPHQLIEGIAIAALAAGAGHCFIFIRGEYWEVADVLDRAVEEAYDAGFLGDSILDTGIRSTSSSTAAPAPTSAARRRRCSTRSRASAATRG